MAQLGDVGRARANKMHPARQGQRTPLQNLNLKEIL
jgi:hypothetical protein